MSYWRGARVGRLRQHDLPAVALALVAHIERKATAWKLEIEDQEMVRIYSEDGRVSTYIRGEDWRKIQPFVRDGFFSPTVTPTAYPVGGLGAGDVVTLDVTRRHLYDRILGTLVQLFPDDYPTQTHT